MAETPQEVSAICFPGLRPSSDGQRGAALTIISETYVRLTLSEGVTPVSMDALPQAVWTHKSNPIGCIDPCCTDALIRVVRMH